MRLPMFTKLTSRVNRNRPVPGPEPVREDLVPIMTMKTKAKTNKTEKVPPSPPPPPQSPKQIELWYKCKSCGLMLKDFSALRSHKEEKHLEEFQELRCIVFLERDLRTNQSRNLEEKLLPNSKAVENGIVGSVPVPGNKAVLAGGCNSGLKDGQGTVSSLKLNSEEIAENGNKLDSVSRVPVVATSVSTLMSNSAVEPQPQPLPHFILTYPCGQTNPIPYDHQEKSSNLIEDFRHVVVELMPEQDSDSFTPTLTRKFAQISHLAVPMSSWNLDPFARREPPVKLTLTSSCGQTNSIVLSDEFHLLCQGKSNGEYTAISLEFEPKLLIGEDSIVKPDCLGTKYLPVPVNPEFSSIEVETDSIPAEDLTAVEAELGTTGTESEGTFITSVENGDDLDRSQYMDALVTKCVDGNWLIPYDQMDTGINPNQTKSGPGPVKENGFHSKLPELYVDVETGTMVAGSMIKRENSGFDLESVIVLNESDCHKKMKSVIGAFLVESLDKSKKSKSAPVSPGFEGGNGNGSIPHRSRSSLSIEIENHYIGVGNSDSDTGASDPHRVQANLGRMELLEQYCSDFTSGILGATIFGTLVKKATNYIFGIVFFIRGGLLAIMDWV